MSTTTTSRHNAGARYAHVRDAAALISHLGGPPCSEDEIRWAADIPSGQRLLEWLAAQVAEDTLQMPDSVAKQPSRVSEPRQDVLKRASVSPIGLYREETDILQCLDAQHKAHSGVTAAGSDTLPLYDLPSRLSARAIAFEREDEALEIQATRLRHRLGQAKAAFKELKDTISAIKAEIQSLRSAKQEREQKLTDLSGEVDDVVGRAEHQATAILQAAERQDNDILPLKHEVASLERARVALSGAIQQLYNSLDDRYGSFPTADELQDHAAALSAKFAGLKGDSASVSDLAAAAYVEELERMTRQLERDPESLQHLTHLPPASSDAKGTRSPDMYPNVKVELERAGRLDRTALLRAQERGLNHAMEELRDRLLPRLQRCHDRLHAQASLAAEAESIISVLIEELEDVNDAIQDSARYVFSKSESPSEILEEAVTDTLKRLLRSRGDDGGRPTVLLSRADVEAELVSLAKRSTKSQEAEERWAAGLSRRLAELTRSHAPLLTATYQNSPMNTSAPFSPAALEVKVGQEARHRADDLTQSALRLQRDSELSSKDGRKLTALIEKWASR
ncbi:hypothetical protein PYCCODRAFT_1419652 [Trametes coccinea BRFM310]|uniref:Uncharacterized protein n=1 Tax=Trametes coccinea (strain BRFM310) TaxID=1353009 RepID=A0A1Y2IBL3_TRAC3|nr:hypothetical protein PYCCODRAFT_1419652 [Trametes coccinea BRFM310]